ncbi:MAG TPA: hypothetical protein VJG32_02990 [Anaerolineae bacterium]|nr:hypothetical protein [Anaerolineae bacterium]
MLNAIRQTVTVQPGGVIVIRQPELPAGTQAEVIVVLEAATLSPREPFDSAAFRAALAESGYDTPEKIVELVRQVKREQAEERS